MTTEWANKLGYDIGTAEVWKHADAFRVFTEDKVMRIPYEVTRNPETALSICESHGLPRKMLDDLEPYEAQALYFQNVPMNRELF